MRQLLTDRRTAARPSYVVPLIHASPPSTTRRSTRSVLSSSAKRNSTWFSATLTEFAFRPHAHEEYFIALTQRGLVTPTYRGDRHVIGPGELIVLNPEEAQAGGRRQRSPAPIARCIRDGG